MERNTTKNFEYGIFTRFDLDQRICRVWFGTKTIELEHIDIPLDKEIEFSDADYVFLLNLEIELYSILLAKNAREKYNLPKDKAPLITRFEPNPNVNITDKKYKPQIVGLKIANTRIVPILDLLNLRDFSSNSSNLASSLLNI